MFIVVSNVSNGWDPDMWGTIGVVDSVESFVEFVKNYLNTNKNIEISYDLAKLMKNWDICGYYEGDEFAFYSDGWKCIILVDLN